MKTEKSCICPSCGKKVTAALKFCPVCMLRGALASDVESGESSSEHAVEPTSQDAAQRFEHYELVTGEDGRPIELGRGAMGVTYNPSIWDPSRLSLFESGDTLVGLKSSAATAELRRPSATVSTDTSRTELLPMSFMVNGRYQVLEALGEGGMGVVYRVADQLHPERALALKTIQSAMLTPERINMFKAEFRTMADLCHPNVATVYDFEPLRDGVDYLFTMEHVDGTDLMAATRGAGQERVVGLVVQICRALSYLHSRGIVHFDLKPANILVRSDDTVKVLDFGLVGSDRRGSVVGTPSYMAPELVSGGTSIDHRVDLYSLGIIIYELLCRRLPFTARTLYDLLHMHATVDVAFTADDAERILQWLQQIVLRLCAKEPAERFRTANAVIGQINRSSGGAHQIETAATKESYILSSRFVGRQAQLDAVLSHVWARTNQNEQIQSCALFVVGPSGVGKTRLVREAKRQIQLAGLPFIDANVRDNGLADHTPIVELLNHISQVATSAGAGELVEQHERSLRQLGVGLSREGATALSDAERKAALEGAADFMIGVAERVAYVIHIGDLQWASTGVEDLTLALLVRLSVSSERRIKLALIGSYRDEELSGRALEAHLAALRSHAAIGVVALEALGNGHVRGLLSSMLGIEELPPAFVDRVCAETGGNPFFVEEVMRSLVEHGGVYIEDGGWATSDDIAQLDIPSSITQVLLRRIAVLTPEAERVLELLAIAARPVDTSVLEAAAGLSSDHFYSALSTLVARQMVEGLKGGLYCLRHDGLRQAILSRRETAQIAQMHGELAQAMERVYKLELDLHVHDLALHYWRAGERQKALSFGLIGRHAEMLALKKSWNDVRAGRGSTLLLEGESGMGKTRLALELTKLARRTGALVLFGKAQPHDPRPYAVLRDAFAQYLLTLARLEPDAARRHENAIRNAGQKVAAVLCRFAPAMASLLDKAPALRALAPEAEQERFRSSIADFLLSLGHQHSAVLLIVDDCQWLDAGSLDILSRVAKNMRQVPLCLVATVRSDEASSEGRDRFVQALGSGAMTRVPVAPLDLTAMSRLAEVQLSGGRVDAELLASIMQRAGGNPFILGQYLRWLEDEHVIAFSAGRWQVKKKELCGDALPQNVFDVLARRVAWLGGQAKSVLTLAAVHGFSIENELLARTVGDPEQAQLGVDEALHANLIEPNQTGTAHSFVHDRVRDAILERIGERDVADAHSRLAEAIRSMPRVEGDLVYALARHQAASSDKDYARIFATNFDAGRLAFENYSFVEAYAFLSEANKAAHVGLLPTSAEFKELLGQTCVITYRVDEALEHFQRGVPLASDRYDAARLHSRCSTIHLFKKDYEASWRSLDACMRLLGAATPRGRPHRIFAAAVLCVFSRLLDGLGLRPFWARNERARKRNEVLVDALTTALLVNYYHQVNIPGVIESGLKIYSVSSVLPPGPSQLLGFSVYGSLAGFLQLKGELDRVTKICLEMGQQMGDIPSLGRAMYYCGFGYFACGDGQRARELFDRAIIEYGHAAEKHVLLSTFMKHVCFLHIQGYSKEALDMADRAISHCAALSTSLARPWLLIYRSIKIAASAELGLDADCREQHEIVTRDFAAGDLPPESLQIKYAGRIHALLASSNLGAPLDACLAEFDQERFRVLKTVMQAIVVYVFRAYARLAQYEQLAPSDRHAMRAPLKRAIRAVLIGAMYRPYRAHYLVLRAGLLACDGKHRAAQSALASAERMGRAAGSRRVLFEVARRRAGIAHALGDTVSAERDAETARALAREAGWQEPRWDSGSAKRVLLTPNL